jgi:hypothetical protein
MADVGFNLDSLLGQYKDFARGYLFKFEIDNAPLGLWKESYPYLVRTTSLPDSNLEEIAVPWQGMTYKLAATQTFNDITVTFNVDKDSLIRYDFVNWVNYIHNPADNTHASPASYMCILNMTHLNTDSSNNIQYVMHGAYPKVVGTAALDYANKDTLQFDVTFSYQYHTIL